MPTLATLSSLTMGRLATMTGPQVFKINATPAKGRDYVVFHPGPGLLPVTRYGASYGLRDWDFLIVCASPNKDGVEHVAEKVRDVLCGWRPTPDIRASGPVTETPNGARILPDNTIENQPLFSTTLAFTHHTVRN